jgi:putative modified peptide
MASTSGGGPAVPTLRVSGAKAEEFVKKLATDDAFRTRLQADPAAALQELGIALPTGLRPGRVSLPSKEDAAKLAGANVPLPQKFAPVFGPRCPIEPVE